MQVGALARICACAMDSLSRRERQVMALVVSGVRAEQAGRWRSGASSEIAREEAPRQHQNAHAEEAAILVPSSGRTMAARLGPRVAAHDECMC
jgi:hypothetical protein